MLEMVIYLDRKVVVYEEQYSPPEAKFPRELRCEQKKVK